MAPGIDDTQRKFPVQPSPWEQMQPTLKRIGAALWDDTRIKPGVPAPAQAPAPSYNPWAAAPAGIGGAPALRPAPAPAAKPDSAPGGFPTWAAEQVKRGGGNPDAFHVEGSQLASSRSPATISADIQAHPPITTSAGRALAPAAVPSIGVQGTAAAPPAPRPGVAAPATPSQVDPVREQMLWQHANPTATRVGKTVMYSGNAGDGGDGPSIAQRADMGRRQAAHDLSAYDLAQAKARSDDPFVSTAAALDAVNATPDRRNTALAMKGVEPGAIAALPRPGVAGEPVNQAGHVDQVAVARLANPEISLHDLAAQHSVMPGAFTKGHLNNTAFLNAVAARRAASEKAFQDAVAGTPDPEAGGSEWYDGMAGTAHAISTGLFNMFGVGDGTPANTGPGWQQRYREQGETNDLLRRFGVQVTPGPVPPQ